MLLATEDAQAAATEAKPAGGAPAMSSAEREAALELLCSADLLERVTDAFGASGVVGEHDSALAAWLTLTSRLSDRPLGAVVQSSSAAGKSTLADAALSLVPAEAKVAYSAMTGQALYYLGDTDLAHKVLAIAEEEGASRASYPLKLLVSEGHLSIAAAGKDPTTGRLVTNTYEVAGPVALLMTTTSAELDDELANRLFVLAVDEGRHQTRAVQAAQRAAETLDGLVARAMRAEVIALHANAQRLLSPVAVVNPHAPTSQLQRPGAPGPGVTTPSTWGWCVPWRWPTSTSGNASRSPWAGKSSPTSRPPKPTWPLSTGCAPACSAPRPTRCPRPPGGSWTPWGLRGRAGQPEFTRRELRDATGLGDTQLKVHLARLVDLEHLTVARAGPATSLRTGRCLPMRTTRSAGPERGSAGP